MGTACSQQQCQRPPVPRADEGRPSTALQAACGGCHLSPAAIFSQRCSPRFCYFFPLRVTAGGTLATEEFNRSSTEVQQKRRHTKQHTALPGPLLPALHAALGCCRALQCCACSEQPSPALLHHHCRPPGFLCPFH